MAVIATDADTKMTVAAVANGTIYLLGGSGDGPKGRNEFSPVVEAYDTGFRAVDAKGKYSTRWGTLKKNPMNDPEINLTNAF